MPHLPLAHGVSAAADLAAGRGAVSVARRGGKVPSDRPLTQILRRLAAGADDVDPDAAAEIYQQLKAMSRKRLRGQPADSPLPPTALVHETFLRLFNGSHASGWTSRAHFFKVAAAAMRSILVDATRHANATRRKPTGRRLDLDEIVANSDAHAAELLDLEAALERLEQRDPRQVRILELRYFAECTIAEIAELTDLSTRTVTRELEHARAWIAKELER
jgi:RNA polymerase sigma-70 factor (ECF subfamily)